MEIELGESVNDGVQHKRLWGARLVRWRESASIRMISPRLAFRDDESAFSWVQYMITYLNRHLPDCLRTMALLTVGEAIAKSSEVHGIAETDWRELAESHAAIVGQKIKDSHGIHSGPERLFKTKQQYLDFLAEAARASRTAGKRFTQGWVAQFASKKYSDARGSDERTVRQWNDDYDVNWKYWSAKVNRRN
jgi:hypothetical protein